MHPDQRDRRAEQDAQLRQVRAWEAERAREHGTAPDPPAPAGELEAACGRAFLLCGGPADGMLVKVETPDEPIVVHGMSGVAYEYRPDPLQFPFAAKYVGPMRGVTMYSFDEPTRSIVKDGVPIAVLVEGVQGEEGGLLASAANGDSLLRGFLEAERQRFEDVLNR